MKLAGLWFMFTWAMLGPMPPLAEGQADGDLIVIEGIREGKYHVIVRSGSTASETVKALARSMLEPADPETLRLWDSWR